MYAVNQKKPHMGCPASLSNNQSSRAIIHTEEGLDTCSLF